MLAAWSMPPARPPSPAPPSMTSPTTTVCSAPCSPAALPIIPSRAPLAQRPKLSINTLQPRSFGKAASLRLDTLGAVSPTRINTFSNAYPTLHGSEKPRLPIDSSLPTTSAGTSTATSTPSSASTPSSTLTSASQESATSGIPCEQPHNLTSIPSNGPVQARLPRKMAVSRPMFPAVKHVSFRCPLEEEITTTKYTVAHSDLESSIATLSSFESGSSPTSTSSGSSSQIPASSRAAQGSDSAPSSNLSSPPSQSPRVGDKRDSSSSEDEGDTRPETPVAGRRKRRRDWRWTLGPLPNSTQNSGALSSSSSTATSDATGSDDSS